ncbi:MAG: ABC transporter permease, partial [Steroidobacteraceae bacterium]
QMGMNRKISAFFNYFMQFLRPLPPLSYMVLLILWFGTGNASKVILLFLTALPIIVSASMAGVRSVPQIRVNGALMLGANSRQIFIWVILPSAAPMIATGLKIALAAAFSTVVAAEFIAAQNGLGWMVLSANKFLQNSTVMMGVVVLGILGMLLSKILEVVERRVVHWRRVG